MPTFHGHGRARIVVSWYLPNSLMFNSLTAQTQRQLRQAKESYIARCKSATYIYLSANSLPGPYQKVESLGTEPLRWKEDLASGRSWEKEGRWTDMFELWMEDWWRLLDLLFRVDESIGMNFREGEVQSSPTNFNFEVYTIEVLLLKLLLHFPHWWTTSLPRCVVTCCDAKSQSLHEFITKQHKTAHWCTVFLAV